MWKKKKISEIQEIRNPPLRDSNAIPKFPERGFQESLAALVTR